MKIKTDKSQHCTGGSNFHDTHKCTTYKLEKHNFSYTKLKIQEITLKMCDMEKEEKFKFVEFVIWKNALIY